MKKWLKISAWALFGIAILTLLSLARQSQNKEKVGEPIILIHAEGENHLLNNDELKTRILRSNLYHENITWENLPIAVIEKFVNKMPEVKSSKVFSDVGNSWTIEVRLRKPLVRIFNKYNESYYLDSEGKIMPITNNCARVIIVNGEIKDRIDSKSVNDIINNDSLKSIQKLDDIYRISNYVCNDPFFQAQIAQIHLLKNGDFVLVPMVGGQIITFGSANNDKEVAEKFKKLEIFYKEGIPYEGWNKYSEINLQYDGQIVCKKKE